MPLFRNVLPALESALAAALLCLFCPPSQIASAERVSASVISPELTGTYTSVSGPVEDMLLPMGPQFTLALFNMEQYCRSGARIDLLARRALRSLDAEILLLQGIVQKKDQNVVQDVAQELSMSFVYAKTGEDGDGKSLGLAVLSKYPVIKSKAVALPSIADPDGGVSRRRVLLAVEIMIQGFGRPIVIMNTETDPYGQRAARISQITRINEYVTGVRPFDGIDDFVSKIKILGGSFMSPVKGTELEELSLFFNQVTSGDALQMRNYPAVNPLFSADHVFTLKSQIWKVKRVEVLRALDGGVKWSDYSSHAPYVLELQLIEQ